MKKMINKERKKNVEKFKIKKYDNEKKKLAEGRVTLNIKSNHCKQKSKKEYYSNEENKNSTVCLQTMKANSPRRKKNDINIGVATAATIGLKNKWKQVNKRARTLSKNSSNCSGKLLEQQIIKEDECAHVDDENVSNSEYYPTLKCVPHYLH
ncbi:hypothetical protein RFI_31439 [Reticulomyxa filosa]|uniref:Uncharacterized protein n=1 Tax=Reticulomyxa filosa TaxID=46433 RepID=X6LXU2_RETFI|nr:hypothetical protein RFI_31439 [Reticulomyxa filosa]|eukprot:ETO05957.1 hypothetical protein RFI_31439 [Reticulomyxa filosa]